jgi:hypothetical protein
MRRWGRPRGPAPRPASEVPSRVGGHRTGVATLLLPRQGGRQGCKGHRRRQAGCSGMQGHGAWGEGAGGWDQGGPRMEV